MGTMRWNHAMRTVQRGFTLVEVMVALLIGLFLLGALLTMVQSTRHAFVDQNQLSQLHDSERMAMSLMSDVIQSAGYFPDPTHNTSGVLAAAPGFSIGQAINGTFTATPPGTGDTITVRFMTASADGILNCSGVPNTSGANILYVNTFKVFNGQLICTDQNNTIYNLVSGVGNNTTTLGVVSMSILYGVKANVAATGNSVDTYLNASQMTTTLWNSVISVQVSLQFTNPLYVAGGSQPQTITVTRDIGVMNQVGPML
jgi:type IV pilus assembly protein PilW